MNRRRKRSTKRSKGRRRKQHHSQPKAKNLCRLESLWVDFKQLDWDDWIISPGWLYFIKLSSFVNVFSCVWRLSMSRKMQRCTPKCSTKLFKSRNYANPHSFPQCFRGTTSMLCSNRNESPPHPVSRCPQHHHRSQISRYDCWSLWMSLIKLDFEAWEGCCSWINGKKSGRKNGIYIWVSYFY